MSLLEEESGNDERCWGLKNNSEKWKINTRELFNAREPSPESFLQGGFTFVQGFDIVKIDKTPLICSAWYFSLGELAGALFGGFSPPKPSRGDGTATCAVVNEQATFSRDLVNFHKLCICFIKTHEKVICNYRVLVKSCLLSKFFMNIVQWTAFAYRNIPPELERSWDLDLQIQYVDNWN